MKQALTHKRLLLKKSNETNTQFIDHKWEMRFMELQNYKKKHGHCHVPITRNNQNPLYSLAQWVNRLRRQYRTKDPHLTAERITKLNSLGFSWRNPYKPGELNRANDTDLLNELKRLHKLLGKAPSPQDIAKHSKHAVQTYRSHFGSTAKARKAAGITAKLAGGKLVRSKTYSDTQLLDELKRLAKKLGSPPSTTDIIKYGKYSATSYSIRFGSIPNARKKAGLDSSYIRPVESITPKPSYNNSNDMFADIESADKLATISPNKSYVVSAKVVSITKGTFKPIDSEFYM